jgi:hypothetical protein
MSLRDKLRLVRHRPKNRPREQAHFSMTKDYSTSKFTDLDGLAGGELEPRGLSGFESVIVT